MDLVAEVSAYRVALSRLQCLIYLATSSCAQSLLYIVHSEFACYYKKSPDNVLRIVGMCNLKYTFVFLMPFVLYVVVDVFLFKAPFAVIHHCPLFLRMSLVC